MEITLNPLAISVCRLSVQLMEAVDAFKEARTPENFEKALKRVDLAAGHLWAQESSGLPVPICLVGAMVEAQDVMIEVQNVMFEVRQSGTPYAALIERSLDLERHDMQCTMGEEIAIHFQARKALVRRLAAPEEDHLLDKLKNDVENLNKDAEAVNKTVESLQTCQRLLDKPLDLLQVAEYHLAAARDALARYTIGQNSLTRDPNAQEPRRDGKTAGNSTLEDAATGNAAAKDDLAQDLAARDADTGATAGTDACVEDPATDGQAAEDAVAKNEIPQDLTATQEEVAEDAATGNAATHDAVIECQAPEDAVADDETAQDPAAQGSATEDTVVQDLPAVDSVEEETAQDLTDTKDAIADDLPWEEQVGERTAMGDPANEGLSVEDQATQDSGAKETAHGMEIEAYEEGAPVVNKTDVPDSTVAPRKAQRKSQRKSDRKSDRKSKRKRRRQDQDSADETESPLTTSENKKSRRGSAVAVGANAVPQDAVSSHTAMGGDSVAQQGANHEERSSVMPSKADVSARKSSLDADNEASHQAYFGTGNHNVNTHNPFRRGRPVEETLWERQLARGYRPPK